MRDRMRTEIITTEIDRAAELIRAGELVAVPTETVYGLAGNGLDEAAVDKIYEVKGRPAVKPLSLMVPGAEVLEKYAVDVPAGAYILAEDFWPGPLTLVLKAAEGVSKTVTAGGDTVGLRCPAQEQTLALLKACEVPLAAPSANPSGAPSPKTAAEVMEYFDGKISAVIDGGACELGTESTLIDLSQKPFRILRAGAVGEEAIRDALIRRLKVVGVTGGTGCGKTTTLQALEELGALVIDADAEYHKLCAECIPMLEELQSRFPGVVVDGVLQRKKLGAIVFADAAAMADLREITERYIDDRIDGLLAQHAAFGGKYAAIDAINLLDTPLRDILCASVGITAPEELRARRIMARDGISEEYAMLRIRAQKPKSYFEENCDICIENDGAPEEFRQTCLKIFGDILEV